MHIFPQSDSITSQSDRMLLEIALVSALATTLDASEVNLYKVQPAGTRLLLERVAHVGADGVSSRDTDFEPPDVSIPVESREETDACVCGEQCVAVRRAEDSRYVHCIPVAFDGKVAAVVELVRKELLDAGQLVGAEGFVSLYRNFLSLLEYSERDTLTGLLNRRTFDEQLTRILATLDTPQAGDPGVGSERRDSAPDAQPHWLAVIDVDHFKHINDDFGHLYGDEVLTLLANLMRETFRHRDRMFRFGGEEFVVVLKPAESKSVMRVLDRFRQRVAEHAFPQVGKVTVSIGFAPIRLGETIAEVLGNADEALYYAKGDGRNQVRNFVELLDQGLIKPRESKAGN